KSGTRIWIAAGFTDLRRGSQGLSSIVETVLEQAPFSGPVFVFRGKRGDLIKLLGWYRHAPCAQPEDWIFPSTSNRAGRKRGVEQSKVVSMFRPESLEQDGQNNEKGRNDVHENVHGNYEPNLVNA